MSVRHIIYFRRDIILIIVTPELVCGKVQLYLPVIKL